MIMMRKMIRYYVDISHLFRDVICDDVELALVLRDRHLVLRLGVRPQQF